jgi:hypothetical protein
MCGCAAVGAGAVFGAAVRLSETVLLFKVGWSCDCQIFFKFKNSIHDKDDSPGGGEG